MSNHWDASKDQISSAGLLAKGFGQADVDTLEEVKFMWTFCNVLHKTSDKELNFCIANNGARFERKL